LPVLAALATSLMVARPAARDAFTLLTVDPS